MAEIKLNVGSGPRWNKEGWHRLDYKIAGQTGTSPLVLGTAEKMELADSSVDIIFSSHMVEHIPQCRLPLVFAEFWRVLKPGGLVRLLTPDLKKLASAYVNDDDRFWEEALAEDENIRTDLGRGGSFLNFVISPGQDTALFDRTLNTFITGIAHQACYDFQMLRILLENAGFDEIEQKGFCESRIEDFREPLHVDGLPAKWEIMNQDFYKRNGLVHYYDPADKQYHINFTVTGFDRDPGTSLIIECKKAVKKQRTESADMKNYEKYGQSLLGDPLFERKLKKILDLSSTLDGRNNG